MQMALPDTYSELYPGRFMKSDSLKGHKLTLTIEHVDVEELIGENNKKAAKVVIRFARPSAALFAKIPLELVVPKTNGECLRRMFGNNPHDWFGKRVTLFPSKTTFGRETVDCIRIWGSPDLTEDMPITVPQGRKKALEMVMHKVENRTSAAKAAPPAASLDPKIVAAFGILEWTENERSEYLANNATKSPAEVAAHLNSIIEQHDSVEA